MCDRDGPGEEAAARHEWRGWKHQKMSGSRRWLPPYQSGVNCWGQNKLIWDATTQSPMWSQQSLDIFVTQLGDDKLMRHLEDESRSIKSAELRPIICSEQKKKRFGIESERHRFTSIPPEQRSGLSCFVNRVEKNVQKTPFPKKVREHKEWKTFLPVQAADYVSHCVDETLVLLWAADDDGVELLHVRVDGVEGRGFSAAYRQEVRVLSVQICIASVFAPTERLHNCSDVFACFIEILYDINEGT